MIYQQWTLYRPKSLKIPVYAGTFLDHTAPLRLRITRESPDSCVSDNVDVVLKKSHKKIKSFRKVIAF